MRNVLKAVITVSIAGLFVSCPSASADLVFWNTLGSQEEIENSVMGLDGICLGGEFIPGVYGYAYSTENEDARVFFPRDVIPVSRGTLECWFKAESVPPLIPGNTGPFLVRCKDYDNPAGQTQYILSFSGNDGLGGGGMIGHAGSLFTTSTGVYGSWYWEDVLGLGQVEQWHHAALVWDVDGIVGVDDGARKVALYLDGQLHSQRWRDIDPMLFPPLTGGPLEVLALQNMIQGSGSLAIDELKIWDFAKTNFPDMPPLQVAFDLKPQSCPNPFDVADEGFMPAAILGTVDFDISTIDVSSLLLLLPEGSLAPVQSSVEDVATPVLDPGWCECGTGGPDGFNDLTLMFDAQDLAAALGNVVDGEYIELCILGSLTDGTLISGCDCLWIIQETVGQSETWGSIKTLY